MEIDLLLTEILSHVQVFLFSSVIVLILYFFKEVLKNEEENEKVDR